MVPAQGVHGAAADELKQWLELGGKTETAAAPKKGKKTGANVQEPKTIFIAPSGKRLDSWTEAKALLQQHEPTTNGVLTTVNRMDVDAVAQEKPEVADKQACDPKAPKAKKARTSSKAKDAAKKEDVGADKDTQPGAKAEAEDANGQAENTENLNTQPAPAGTDRRRAATTVTSYKEKAGDGRHRAADRLNIQEEPLVETELDALQQTGYVNLGTVSKRRLTDFVVVTGQGDAIPLELALLLPGGSQLVGVVHPITDDSKADLKKAVGRRVKNAFGPLKDWTVVYTKAGWTLLLTTANGVYDATKPRASYRKTHTELTDLLDICHQVYLCLCTDVSGSMTSSWDEVLAKLTRAHVGQAYGGPRDALLLSSRLVLSQLSAMGKQGDHAAGKGPDYVNTPFGTALQAEAAKSTAGQAATNASGAIRIADGSTQTAAAKAGSVDPLVAADAEMAARMQARLNEEERKAEAAGAGGKAGPKRAAQPAPYIRISEQEIADDYPMPTEYKKVHEEMDELLLTDPDDLAVISSMDPEMLPRRTLADFAFYNSEGYLSSLELVPMFNGVDHDVDIWGSGVVQDDDGQDWALGGIPTKANNTEATAAATGSAVLEAATTAAGAGGSAGGSAGSAGEAEVGNPGMRVYLGQIKEWYVEASADMLFIHIRTEVAWYKLLQSQALYQPWFNTVVKAAKVALTVLHLVSEQERASRISFGEVLKKLADLPETNPGFVSKKVDRVQRFVVVHGQIILNQFKHYPNKAVQRAAFVSELRTQMEQRKHCKLYMATTKHKGKIQPKVRAANPMGRRAAIGLKAKPMPATATRMVKQVWHSYFNSLPTSPEQTDEAAKAEAVEAVEAEEPDVIEQEALEQQAEENALASTPSKKKPREKKAAADATDKEEQAEEADKTKAKKAEAAAADSKKAARKKGGKAKKAEPLEKADVVSWVGDILRKDAAGRTLYGQASVGSTAVKLGDVILLRGDDSDNDGSGSDDESAMEVDAPAAGQGSGMDVDEKPHLDWDAGTIGLVSCLYQDKAGKRYVQVRVLLRGVDTVLGDVSAEAELFMTSDTEEVLLSSTNMKPLIQAQVNAVYLDRAWDRTKRLVHFQQDQERRARNEAHASLGEPLEYFYRSLYCPERGMFCNIPAAMLAKDGTFIEPPEEPVALAMLPGGAGFIKDGVEYKPGDVMFLHPETFVKAKKQKPKKRKSGKAGGKRKRDEEAASGSDASSSSEEDSELEEEDEDKIELPEYLKGKHKGGTNRGLKPFALAQLVRVKSQSNKLPSAIVIRRLYRPEDIKKDMQYEAGWWDCYAGPLPSESDKQSGLSVDVDVVIGKAAAKLKAGHGKIGDAGNSVHTFLVVGSYDPSKPGQTGPAPTSLAVEEQAQGSAKAAKPLLSTLPVDSDSDSESDSDEDDECPARSAVAMASLDIFAGCGGLSEGMHQAGVAKARWGIEYEPSAAQAFQLNNPDAKVFNNNCNVLLQAAMARAGLADDCDAHEDAIKAAGELTPEYVADLPKPGEVEFIMGGPPCQGYSGMNRFNKRNWSLVQNSMVMGYLSYADFYRPRYFLLENVRNFVTHNHSTNFRLTIRTLLEIGYQVRFGVLNAGNYGVPQSRKRTIIWAAAPDERLPEWPRPRHVFHSPQLTINLPGGVAYTAVPEQPGRGAPLRAVTVKDAIWDLPVIQNGHSEDVSKYQQEAASAYQKSVRRGCSDLLDHICKEMNEINLERCRCIPKGRPGADWRELERIVREDPSREHFKCSNGQTQTLVPWCLPNTAARHNGWRGLYGRLDPAGHFPTSTTDPQPMGKVGQVFHPTQDRIISVRECARAQGFPDWFRFYGNVNCKHRQVGNAVPPPLACALGGQLRPVLEAKQKADMGRRMAAQF